MKLMSILLSAIALLLVNSPKANGEESAMIDITLPDGRVLSIAENDGRLPEVWEKIREFSAPEFAQMTIKKRAHISEKRYTADYLEETINAIALERPVYWLEMLNIADEWEKTILIFGYFDNGSACETTLQLAREDAPFREFRCSASE